MLRQISKCKNIRKESCFFPHVIYLYYLDQVTFSLHLFIMDANKTKTKTKNQPRDEHLTILETCCSGIIMGLIAYSGSFSTVPIVFTLTALIFGTKSLITIFATAIGLLAAGYLHTHASRTGMSVSTSIYHGFYIAKPEMRNRRHYHETRWQSLKRYFILAPMNAFVLNFMWETFTIYYIIHTEFMMIFIESSITNETENVNRNQTISLSSNKELGSNLILLNGVTRFIAGCLSGMSTGLINHLWQRYRARSKIPHAIFNTNKKKLKLESKEREKLLSPFNMENWIKASTMALGALFFIASNIPNRSGLHLLDVHKKRLITDVLVIHGGWLYLRDSAMLVFKKKEKAPEIPLNTIQTPLMVEEVKTMDENQEKI